MFRGAFCVSERPFFIRYKGPIGAKTQDKMGLFAFLGRNKSAETVAEEKQELQRGLDKTKESVLKKLARAVAGKSTVDDEVLDNLEEVLVTSDVGVETTLEIIDRLQERVRKDRYLNTSELNKVLREEISQLLIGNPPVADPWTQEGKKPYVIMVVGVNGVG